MEKKLNIVDQRKQRIINYLRKHKVAKTADLSKSLNVSEVTIRRDIKEFEDSNHIERFHGGIRLIQDITDNEVLYEEKGGKYTKEKKEIAKETVKHIEDGDTIFINSGSTTLYVLKEINDSGKIVKIITNNALAPTVIDRDSVELLITGGEYRAKSKSLVGENAIQMISNIVANKCILGINGISAEDGIFTSVYQEAGVNEQMIESCFGEVIVVADHSKIGKVYNFRSAAIEKIDVLVVNNDSNRDEINNLKEKGVNVIIP
ncbi:DeoR/GlpR family DNA-binding transcription regulator [Bacillus sp. SD088]|uniref:DeoR/GlpR family DNA-binding transcription regulator n=1 Tax=Bacillus sp. SD088 TaxID=2782012 RepID=UPI001A969040|nr:DeoR/GlpR family DNA-binding transcription regulator [Bacillus sp. SD088]MBO0993156.1 DeoR/GlpR transcriptional regulator [Bacillus sp. SD088]